LVFVNFFYVFLCYKSFNYFLFRQRQTKLKKIMSNIGEVTSLSNNKLNTNENATVNPPRTPQFGGIKSLIQHSNVLGNVILASENKSVEPLPFSNYSLFDETYGNYI
jgi:hypothetical protein